MASDAAAPAAPVPATDAQRERLKEFFLKTVDSDVPRRWDDIWKADFLPFDRGVANPALDEALQKYVVSDKMPSNSSSSHGHESMSTNIILGSPVDVSTGRRRTALVPGCGRGYDVLLLAAYGYDAWGLEISETAVLACEELKSRVERAVVSNEPLEDSPGLSAESVNVYRTRSAQVGRGSARYVVGDFFADPKTWEAKFSPLSTSSAGSSPSSTESSKNSENNVPEKFDLIVDYTFLCALPPSLRPRWAQTMKRLLASAEQARLLCVEFPTYKDPAVRGPPWGMQTRTYIALLSRIGEKDRDVEYDADMNAIVAEQDTATIENGQAVSNSGMIRLAHYKCGRTHAIGKDTDRLSVWRKVMD